MAEIKMTLDTSALTQTAVNVKQYDADALKLLVTVKVQGETVEISDEAMSTFSMARSDGESKAYMGTVEDGKVRLNINSWHTAVAGQQQAELSVYDDGRLTTYTFILNVVEAAVEPSEIISPTDAELITELIERTEQATSDATTATETALTAASEANSAAEKATKSASTADDAAQTANTAALDASSKAMGAAQATLRANTAAENAENATTSANTAAGLANEAATNANAATVEAQKATDDAISATTAANTAAGTANEKAILANSAAERAESATGKAESATETVTALIPDMEKAKAVCETATENAVTATADCIDATEKAKEATVDIATKTSTNDVVLEKTANDDGDMSLHGYYNAGVYTANERWRASDYISVTAGHRLHVETNLESKTTGTVFARCYAYDADKTLLGSLTPSARSISPDEEGVWSFNLLTTSSLIDNYAFVTMSLNTTSFNNYDGAYFKITDLDAASEEVISIKDGVLLPTADRERIALAYDGRYVRARRPEIAVTFDGDYSKNGEASDIAEKYGIKVAFAPLGRKSGSFGVMGNSFYEEKQRHGHEILLHGNIIFQDTTPASADWDGTVDGAFNCIKAYYDHFCDMGFKSAGFIGSHGLVDEKYMGAVYRYFGYGSTLNNTTDGEAYSYVLGNNRPYRLFRYSLNSTAENITAVLDRVSSNDPYYGAMIFYIHARGESDSGTPIDLEDFESKCALIKTYIDANKLECVQPHELVNDFFAIRYDDVVDGLIGGNA